MSNQVLHVLLQAVRRGKAGLSSVLWVVAGSAETNWCQDWFCFALADTGQGLVSETKKQTEKNIKFFSNEADFIRKCWFRKTF